MKKLVTSFLVVLMIALGLGLQTATAQGVDEPDGDNNQAGCQGTC